MALNSALYNVMTAAVLKASRGIARDFGEVDQLQISRKGTANFVTKTDQRSERILQEELGKARPKFGFLMEESGEIPGQDPEFRWLIDPLDGTTNFIHAMPYFAITVAVEKRHANGFREIVAGVVYDPIHNEMFFAEKGQGAYLNERRMMVSRRESAEEMMFVTGSLQLEQAGKMLMHVGQSGAALRLNGSAALDLAYIAAGRYDGYWHFGLKPWDIAAGMLLIKEAGGVVSEMAGGDLFKTGNILAAAPSVHAKMEALFKA